MLDEFLSFNIFALFLVFARIGSALMLLPGFGESFVAPRIRLLLAIVIAVLVTPVVESGLPGLPESPFQLLLLLVGEIGVGIFFGALARTILAGLFIAGMLISYQIGLANAFVNDLTAAQQGSIVGNFLTTTGLLLLFLTNTHHLMLASVIQSYTLFEAGSVLPLGDFAHTMTFMVAQSFVLAAEIADPFFIIGMVFYLGLGLLGRLMPQVQVFFITMPVQIAVGLMVLALTSIAALSWFLNRFQESFTGVFLAG